MRLKTGRKRPTHTLRFRGNVTRCNGYVYVVGYVNAHRRSMPNIIYVRENDGYKEWSDKARERMTSFPSLDMPLHTHTGIYIQLLNCYFYSNVLVKPVTQIINLCAFQMKVCFFKQLDWNRGACSIAIPIME